APRLRTVAAGRRSLWRPADDARADDGDPGRWRDPGRRAAPTRGVSGGGAALASAGSSAGRLPVRLGVDRRVDHTAAVALDRLQHRAHKLVAEIAGLEPEVQQLCVDRVVVMVLGLDAGVLEMLDVDLEADLGRGALHQLGELGDRELLGELVEDPELARI